MPGLMARKEAHMIEACLAKRTLAVTPDCTRVHGVDPSLQNSMQINVDRG